MHTLKLKSIPWTWESLKIGCRRRVRRRVLRRVTWHYLWRRRIARLLWCIPWVLSWLFSRVLGRGVTGVPGLLRVPWLGPARAASRVGHRVVGRGRHGHHGLRRPRVETGPVVDVAGWDGGGISIPHHRGTYWVWKGHNRVPWDTFLGTT